MHIRHTLAPASQRASQPSAFGLINAARCASISRLGMPVNCLLKLAMPSFCFRFPKFSNNARNEKIRIDIIFDVVVWFQFFLCWMNYAQVWLARQKTNETKKSEDRRISSAIRNKGSNWRRPQQADNSKCLTRLVHTLHRYPHASFVCWLFYRLNFFSFLFRISSIWFYFLHLN